MLLLMPQARMPPLLLPLLLPRVRWAPGAASSGSAHS